MPKKHKITKSKNIESSVMGKIISNEVAMKPRWYFFAGTLLGLVGLVSSTIVAVFLTNLSFFFLKQHGPNGEWRLQQILESFPIWAPLLAIVGLFGGLLMLRKYDFSYKKNFWSVALIFTASIIFAAYILDYTGLSDIWMKRGPMNKFYQQQFDSVTPQRGAGQGKGQGRFINNY